MTTTTHNVPFARRAQSQNQNAQKPAPTLPVQNAQNATQAAPRKRPVTWKDLVIKYMLSGIDAVRSVLDESGDPVGSLDKMIEEIGTDQDTQELADLRDHYASLHAIGQPGRQPVKVGDVREYNVQQAGEDGDLFVRIPLNMFSVQRAQKVAVSFEKDQILITRIG